MNHKSLLKLAIMAGEIMLRNGAETYRVEDTINRILNTQNLDVVESFVTPTGIFATIDDPSIEMITLVKRVQSRTIHLEKVALANDVSRRFVAGSLSISEAIEELKSIQKMGPYGPFLMILSVGMAAAFFTLVFGGTLLDFFSSLVIGFVLAIIQHFLEKTGVSRFLINILGGSLISLLALLFVNHLNFGNHLDLIIIGSIMPLVPGVAITNAVRDTIQGDLVSGISRGIEAFFIAISIATGVGIMLKIYMVILGGIPL